MHFDSPDERGIDTAMLYRKDYITINSAEQIPVYLTTNEGRRDFTRDILHVNVTLEQQTLHILINHWPSRRAGAEVTSAKRIAVAERNRTKINELLLEDSDARIIVMGDFNDDPIESSFKKIMKTKAKKKNVGEMDIYNPYEDLHRRGFNTLGYRDNINLFDMILISSPLLDKGKKDFSDYKMFQAKIFNKRFLTGRKGQYKGYPFRSFSNNKFTGGFSDHFPVYMYVIKEVPSVLSDISPKGRD